MDKHIFKNLHFINFLVWIFPLNMILICFRKKNLNILLHLAEAFIQKKIRIPEKTHFNVSADTCQQGGQWFVPVVPQTFAARSSGVGCKDNTSVSTSEAQSSFDDLFLSCCVLLYLHLPRSVADSLLSSHLNSPLPHPLLHSLKTVTPDSSAVVQCTPFNKKLMNRRTHREIQSAPNRRITVASLSLHQGALQRWSVFKGETAAKNEQILCELLRVNRPECGTFKRLIQ